MFETALWEVNGGPRQVASRWFNLPVAIAAHGLFGLSIVVLSYWRVGAVPEPNLPSVFVRFSPPPPLELGSPRGNRERVRPTQPATAPATPVQPQPDPTPSSVPATIPDAAPVDEGIDEPFGSEEGVTGGDPLGSEDGVLGGTDDSDGVVAEPEPEVVYQYGGGIEAPIKVYAPLPQYTEPARRARKEGVMIVQALIDRDGNVTQVKIVRGLGLGLDESAMTTVHQWRFEPARLQGRSVSIYYNLTIHFHLQ